MLRLEGELERAHRLATLGLLAGSIAHEFNNILTPVLSYAQLALASPDDRELGIKALRKVIEGTEKASLIASSILGFTRDESQPAEANVRATVDDALRCIGRDLTKEGIALEIEVSRTIVAGMKPIALEQVLVNLILNAVEAIRPATGKLRIAARHESPQQGVNMTVIEIDDSGRGIPVELQAHVFEPFVSARSAQSSKGTGLGLTICRRLVEEARGTIGVSSRPGEGTVFTLRLPSAAR